MSEGCTHDCSTCSSKCSEKTCAFRAVSSATLKSYRRSQRKGRRRQVPCDEPARFCHAGARTRDRYNGRRCHRSVHTEVVRSPRQRRRRRARTSAHGEQDRDKNNVSQSPARKEDAPVVWRGPVIAGVIQQFWSEVVWGDVDYMFVDMPPGTGDVPLTVSRACPSTE